MGIGWKKNVAVLLVALTGLAIQPLPARSGPVSDLVTQSQQLHAQATMLVASPQLTAQYSSWESQYAALTAAINAELPYANNGEYQAPVIGQLEDQGGYGTGNCPAGGSVYSRFGGQVGGCELNLQLQTGYFVLLYYQQLLVGDDAMLQQALQNANITYSQTPQVR